MRAALWCLVLIMCLPVAGWAQTKTAQPSPTAKETPAKAEPAAQPAAKAAINARHYRDVCEAPERAGGQRGNGRDMLTLFDESGVVVVYADEELAGLLRGFHWKELFWRQRERLHAAMDFYLFGHSLYEKAMQPYIGMTGQGLLLAVGQEFFAMSLPERLAPLDGLLVDYLDARQHCRSRPMRSARRLKVSLAKTASNVLSGKGSGRVASPKRKWTRSSSPFSFARATARSMPASLLSSPVARAPVVVAR